MLKEERYVHILSILEAENKVSAASLSQALRLSEATVRRDLTELDALGKLRKVHGGAVPVRLSPISFQQRQDIQPDAKRKIAEKVFPLLARARMMIIDAGTTTLALVKRFPPGFTATCLTNSPAIAQHLARHAGIEVLLTGGRYEARDEALVGPWAIQTLQQVHADVCVLGVCSLHAQHGLTTDDAEQAAVKQAMIQRSRCTIALADAAKIDTVATYRVAEVCQLTTLVADLPPDDSRWGPYREQKIAIV